MGSVYRETYTRPLPETAALFTRKGEKSPALDMANKLAAFFGVAAKGTKVRRKQTCFSRSRSCLNKRLPRLDIRDGIAVCSSIEYRHG